MAGVPKVEQPGFYKAASNMRAAEVGGVWMLRDTENGAIVYKDPGKPLTFDATALKGDFHLYHIDPKTGRTMKKERLKTGKKITFNNDKSAEILWITKNKK